MGLASRFGHKMYKCWLKNKCNKASCRACTLLMPHPSMCALGILRSMSLWQDQRIFFYPFKEGCIKYTLLQQSSIPDKGRHKDCRCSQTGFQKSLFRTLPDTACLLRRITCSESSCNWCKLIGYRNRWHSWRCTAPRSLPHSN